MKFGPISILRQNQIVVSSSRGLPFMKFVQFQFQFSIPIFNSNFQFQFSIFQFSIFQFSIFQFSILQFSILQFSILQFSILQNFNLHFFKRPSQNDHLNTIISILPSQNDHHNTTIPMVPNSISNSNSNFNLPFFSTQLSFTCTWKHDLLMVRLIIYLSSNKVHIINHHS